VDVPDAHKGDYGLECFTLDGYAFQCYAPEEPLTVNERYKRQRGKINDDIKKFTDNTEALQEIFQSTTIHKWILVTPTHDSAELTRYCGRKTSEVLSADIPYVAPDFRILVHSKETYSYEEQRLMQAALHRISTPVPTILDESAVAWFESNGDHAQTLQAKMPEPNTAGTTDHGGRRLRVLVRRYLQREYLLNQLREDYPDLYGQVQELCTSQEQMLETEQALPAGATTTTLRDHLATLRTNLERDCPFLGGTHTAAIADGSVAAWLIQCSLNFATDNG